MNESPLFGREREKKGGGEGERKGGIVSAPEPVKVCVLKETLCTFCARKGPSADQTRGEERRGESKRGGSQI